MKDRLKNRVKPYSLHLHDARKLNDIVKRGSVDLLIADPPYNFGIQYADYADDKPAEEYMRWTRQWLDAAYVSLHDYGSMWIFVPDEWVSEIDRYCRRTLGTHRRNWVIWTFTFGQSAKKSFTRSHLHLLYFVKNKSAFTYNADVMKVPSARQLVYKDKRAAGGGKQPDDTWCLLKSDLEAALRADGDVWSHSRICGTYKEREAHSPNQIPLPITDRIIRSCSDPGDLVVDPFLGTGGSGVSALALGRMFVGLDISKSCIDASKKRLDACIAGVATDGRAATTRERRRK